MVDRMNVRLTLADPTKLRVFFTKVEATFHNLGNPRPGGGRYVAPADHAALESNLRTFLQAVAPIYEESFLALPPGREQEADAPGSE